jgi:hypothetical protein
MGTIGLTACPINSLSQGVSTMITVDQEAGVKLYGPLYVAYETFIMKHAIITQVRLLCRLLCRLLSK